MLDPARRAGRLIGGMIAIQMIGGTLVNFVLEKPLFGSPGFLLAAAGHARQLGLAVVLSLIVEATFAGVAITAFPVFRPRQPALALWMVVLGGVVLALAVLENAAVMSMVSVSQAYIHAAGPARDQLEAVRSIVASARNWPHYLARLTDGVSILVLYILLYRGAAVPRLLAGFGALAAALQIMALGMTLFDHDVVFPLLAPLGVSQLLLTVWLLAKGFGTQAGRSHAQLPSTSPSTPQLTL